jgi:hypothetical protein
LRLPVGLEARGGVLFVADNGNDRIQKFSLSPTAVRPARWGWLKARYDAASRDHGHR